MRLVKLSLWSVLPLLATATGAFTETNLRRQLQSNKSDAPTPARVGGSSTPHPTASDTVLGRDNVTAAPLATPTSGAMPTGGSGASPVPVSASNRTSAPSSGSNVTPTAATTPAPGTQDTTPVPVSAPIAAEPTRVPAAHPTRVKVPTPERATPAPTPRPEFNYVANDDDPLQPLSPVDEGTWEWKDSNIQQLEHDRTALIAVTVTFCVGLFLAIATAQQLLENPHGCCARYVASAEFPATIEFKDSRLPAF